MQNNWEGANLKSATGSPFPQSEPLPSSALWQPGVCESGVPSHRRWGNLSRETPPSLASSSVEGYFQAEGEPQRRKRPLLLGPPSPRLWPSPFPKAREPGICNPSPTPCFPGTQSPKFSASSAALPKGGRLRAGGEQAPPGRLRGGECGVVVARDPGTAGPTRPEPGASLPPAGLQPRRPPLLPLPLASAAPRDPSGPPSTYPEGVGAIDAAEVPEPPCGRLGHGGRRRADGPGCWRRRRWRRGRRQRRREPGAATPPGWPARHGDAGGPALPDPAPLTCPARGPRGEAAR